MHNTQTKVIIRVSFFISLFIVLSACSTTEHERLMNRKEAQHLKKEAYNGNLHALDRLKRQADAGNIYGELELSEYYWHNTFDDNYNAIHKYLSDFRFWNKKLINNAIEHSNAKMENMIADSYYTGIDENQNPIMALKLWNKSADLGYGKAQNNLGKAYWYGTLGIKQNYSKANYWYRMVAAHGNPDAETMLSLEYWHGYSVKKSWKKTIYWLNKALKNNYSRAQYYMGDAYYLGGCMPKNKEKAVGYWKMATKRLGMHRYTAEEKIKAIQEQGVAKAQAETNVGLSCYYSSKVFSKALMWQNRNKESVYWFRKAAKMGDSKAEFYLGNAYYKGKGVPQNYEKAAFWWRLAAEQGGNYGAKAQRMINMPD